MSTGNRRARSCSSTTGRDLLDHEVADRLAEELVLGGQIEVHRPRVPQRLTARSCGVVARVLAFGHA